MKKKKPVLYRTEEIYRESTSGLSNGIDAFINQLHQINKDAKKDGYTDIVVDFEDEWGYYDDCWTNMIVRGKKPMSVKEFIDGDKKCIKS